MSAPLSTDEWLIEKLLAHLRAEGYSLRIQRWYPARVRQLLNYCNRNGLSIETVRSGHVTQFLRGAISTIAETVQQVATVPEVATSIHRCHQYDAASCARFMAGPGPTTHRARRLSSRYRYGLRHMVA